MDHRSQQEFLRLANSEKKFKKFNFRRSQITELYAYQPSQKVSLNQNSTIQILVADHGSQIAARILELANSEQKFKRFNFRRSRITDHRIIFISALPESLS